MGWIKVYYIMCYAKTKPYENGWYLYCWYNNFNLVSCKVPDKKDARRPVLASIHINNINK